MRTGYFILAFLAFLVFLAPATRAADEKAQDAAYWRSEGDKSVQSREYDKAIECYKKSHAIDPLYARTVFRIAHVYNAERKFEQAQPYLDKALELVKSGKDTSGFPLAISTPRKATFCCYRESTGTHCRFTTSPSRAIRNGPIRSSGRRTRTSS